LKFLRMFTSAVMHQARTSGTVWPTLLDPQHLGSSSSPFSQCPRHCLSNLRNPYFWREPPPCEWGSWRKGRLSRFQKHELRSDRRTSEIKHVYSMLYSFGLRTCRFYKLWWDVRSRCQWLHLILPFYSKIPVYISLKSTVDSDDNFEGTCWMPMTI
jgi:hypothetical protein